MRPQGSTTYMMARISLALADVRAGKLRAPGDHTEALVLIGSLNARSAR
jgi:hypothetical protein